MTDTIQQIRTELYDRFFELEAMENGLTKLNLMLSASDNAIAKINAIVAAGEFDDPQDEIDFFKVQKPELLARRIEELTRYNLIRNMPIGMAESKIKYFEDELKARKSFFRMHNFHYQYFKNRLSDLDASYFIRRSGQPSIPVAEFSEVDNEFSTPLSYLFAKFMAYENIQYFILEQISMIRYPDFEQPKAAGAAADLKWTGDSVNAVELAYGLWLTGQLNNGNASLNQIVRWLESSLHISIGIIQRRFNEIERRKRLSFTKFIDQMKEAIMRKIDDGNS